MLRPPAARLGNPSRRRLRAVPPCRMRVPGQETATQIPPRETLSLLSPSRLPRPREMAGVPLQRRPNPPQPPARSRLGLRVSTFGLRTPAHNRSSRWRDRRARLLARTTGLGRRRPPASRPAVAAWKQTSGAAPRSLYRPAPSKRPTRTCSLMDGCRRGKGSSARPASPALSPSLTYTPRGNLCRWVWPPLCSVAGPTPQQ